MKFPVFFAVLFSCSIFPCLLAQEVAMDAAASSPSPGKAAAAPVDLYSLDYDEDRDIFSAPNTKTPYTGPTFSVYDDGKKESEGALKDGLQDGRWKEFAEDGTVISDGSYKDGLEVGPWKYWSDTGVLLVDGTYAAGKPVGVWKTFYETGKPETEGVYENGLMSGAWKVYDVETGAVEVKTYTAGVQTSR